MLNKYKVYSTDTKMLVYGGKCGGMQKLVFWENGAIFLGLDEETEISEHPDYLICKFSEMLDRKDKEVYEEDIIDVYNDKGQWMFRGVVKFGSHDVQADDSWCGGHAQGFYIEYMAPSWKGTTPGKLKQYTEALGNCEADTESANIEVIGNTIQHSNLLSKN